MAQYMEKVCDILENRPYCYDLYCIEVFELLYLYLC